LAPTPRVCPICGGDGTPWVRTAAANIKECCACQLAFSDRTWLDSATLYTGNGYHIQYFNQEPYLRSVFSRMLKEVEIITTGRRLYEVGCGVGILLDEARNRGYEVSGIEYSPGAARTAQERFGIVVEEGSFSPPDASAARAGGYDIVVVNHVLEHVDDPVAMLKGAATLLRPGGVLVVGVPDAADLWTRLSVWFGYYNVLAPEQHLWHFRQLSLDRLHRLAGLVPVRWLHMNRKLGATSWKELVRSITVMIGSILGRHGALVCYSQPSSVEGMTQGIAHVGLTDARNRHARPFAPVSAVILTHNNEDTVEACL
jgi:2-polyprenyl-3-methyl-5-hydroxy-6-metoxy-1,4-benzoquinol methylase